MRVPPFPDAFEVLCLQAADEGRGDILFGDCLARARMIARPFMVGDKFPSVYLEFPLAGEPFLDVTALYSNLKPGTRISSETAAGTEAMLDWFADACSDIEGVCCGYEIDVKDPALSRAAVHFQPRKHLDLVRPFCEVVGEPKRADLYLDLAKRMPEDWRLSYFGMFRGRPGSPLRVCGYLGGGEVRACAEDPGHIAAVFDQIGFSAYDGPMLDRISTLMSMIPGVADFQLDVCDDGTLGETFAIDVQFGIEQPEAVCASFDDGPAARVLGLLQDWGAADGRWKLAGDAAFARSVDVELDEGNTGRFAFTLMPQWAKVRWQECRQRTCKLYLLASANIVS